MTPLMMLALTLPPSLAFVIARLVAFFEAQARTSAADDIEAFRKLMERVKQLEVADGVTDNAFAQLAPRLEGHEAELKRLSEQLTTLSERVYRQ